MANHVSALKRARQSELQRVRNKSVRTKVRNHIKAVREAIDSGDAEKAREALQAAVPMIDKAAGKGVLHRNNAARQVSRLSKKVHTLSA